MDTTVFDNIKEVKHILSQLDVEYNCMEHFFNKIMTNDEHKIAYLCLINKQSKKTVVDKLKMIEELNKEIFQCHDE